MRRALILMLVLACGGKPAPKPPPPSSPDAKSLARQLDDDMTQLAALATLHINDCPALTAALRPLVDRMKQHAREVEAMLDDLVKAKALKAELAAYAQQTPSRTDQIAADLGSTYKSCQDHAEHRHQLERVIADIPTY